MSKINNSCLFKNIGHVLLLFLTVTGCIFAQEPTVKELEEAADLILIGRARLLSIDGALVTVEITPVRQLKGNLATASETTVIIKVPVKQENADMLAKFVLPNQRQQDFPNSLRMWFLKTQGGESWEALRIVGSLDELRSYYVMISDPPLPNDFAYEPSSTVQARLIKELGAEMERVFENNNGKLYTRDGCLLRLAGSLSTASMDGVAELSKRFSKSTSDHLRALALSWKIRGADSDALNELENERKLLERQEAEINSAIGSYLGKNPAFITGLGKLTGPSFPTSTREQAGYVLWVVHSKEALPFLAAMLDSDLVSLKHDGVMGLASYALNLPIIRPELIATMNWKNPQPGSESLPYAIPVTEVHRYMPAIDVFGKDQSRYTGYWKSWWAKNRRVLEQP